MPLKKVTWVHGMKWSFWVLMVGFIAVSLNYFYQTSDRVLVNTMWKLKDYSQGDAHLCSDVYHLLQKELIYRNQRWHVTYRFVDTMITVTPSTSSKQTCTYVSKGQYKK